MPITRFPLAQPGFSTSGTLSFGNVFVDGTPSIKPGGGVISGTKSRDPGNSDGITILRTGLSMAYHTTNKNYAPWKIGASTANLAGTGTTLTLSAAQATELNRRIGASGTFVLTGPEAAAGTVQQRTVTYSAINTTTGAVTITALGTNQVDRIRFNIAGSGGNLQLNVQKTDGTRVTTANIAWSATDATYLASINSALDTSTGVTGGIVATAISATDTDLGFELTYSGTGYAGKTWTGASVVLMPTSSTEWFYEHVTVAAQGAFLAGAVVSESGYSLPATVLNAPPKGDPSAGDIDWALIPDGGRVDVTQLLDYPSDASFKTWFKQNMSTLAGGKYSFSDNAH